MKTEKNKKQEKAKTENAKKQEEVKTEKVKNQQKTKTEKVKNQEKAKTEKAKKQGEAKTEKAKKQEEVKTEKAKKQGEVKTEKAKKQEEVKTEKTKKQEEVKTEKEEKQKEVKNKKEKKPNKFIEIIKKKWLAQGTTTAILVIAIISLFIAVSVVLHNMELSPIDLSQEKLFTLTDESKDKVREINQNVNIYFMDATDDDENYELAKQFHNVNEKINVEKIDSKERTDIVAKYDLQAGAGQIVVASDTKSKILTSYDLVSSDLMGQTSSIADKKLTNTILYVTANEVPKVYLLEGFSDFSSDRMKTFISVIGDDAIDVETLNVITTGKIPDDCQALIITTPNKDFDEATTTAIMDYINKGGNMLWLNSSLPEKIDLPNANKILAEYAINPFEVGSILETDTSKMASGQPYIILPEVSGGDATGNVTGAGKAVLFLNPTKINKADNETFKAKNATSTTIMQASEKSIYKSNLSSTNMSKEEGDQDGPFDIGVLLEKTLKEEDKENNVPALTSKMILVGENYFASDLTMSQQQPVPLIYYANNADLVVGMVSSLVDKEEEIKAEKSTGAVSYSPTEQQNIIILVIIFLVPALIILAGIIVWIIRRRKK